MKSFDDLLEECRKTVGEIFPWDLSESLENKEPLIILDVREPDEFDAMHINGSISVPRGILETSIEWNFDETIPELVMAREKRIVIVCRSGNRSLLAGQTMQWMGYKDVVSLKTGVRGWSEYDQPLLNSKDEIVDVDDADEFFRSHVRDDQLAPE